jgi:hypothetical protein
MDHALLVGRLQRIRDLPRPRQRIGEGDRAARDHVGEGLALDEFEDDRGDAVDFSSPYTAAMLQSPRSNASVAIS